MNIPSPTCSRSRAMRPCASANGTWATSRNSCRRARLRPLSRPALFQRHGRRMGRRAGQPPAKRTPPLPLVRDEKVIETLKPADQDRLTERYTDEAMKFITAQQGRAVLPVSAAHGRPCAAASRQSFQGKSANGRYGDWVEEVDWSTGRVLDTLRELEARREHARGLHQRQRPVADPGQRRRRGRPAARRQGRHLRRRRARADDRLVARPHPGRQR